MNYLLYPSDIILTGDFNIHMDNTSNNYANQFKDLLSTHGLIQHITAPIHRYGHCLELMITRENIHHIPRPKKTGGGVALLFRSSLSVSIKNDNIDYLTFESLHAEITCNSRSVRLVNIYRPERDVDGKHVNFSSFLAPI